LRPHDAQTERRSRRHRIAEPADATADRIVLEINHNKEPLACATSALSQGGVANHEARGLSEGRNTGVAAATGDLIAFIDDDAVIDASSLDYSRGTMQRPRYSWSQRMDKSAMGGIASRMALRRVSERNQLGFCDDKV
jgi:glycosyltransferase involved in cell wall biosynthesis